MEKVQQVEDLTVAVSSDKVKERIDAAPEETAQFGKFFQKNNALLADIVKNEATKHSLDPSFFFLLIVRTADGGAQCLCTHESASEIIADTTKQFFEGAQVQHVVNSLLKTPRTPGFIRFLYIHPTVFSACGRFSLESIDMSNLPHF